jgi:non-ribosomal peptide synthetase component E (peptide arylation enzyme)
MLPRNPGTSPLDAKRFIAFDEFPLTNLGKVQKNKIREIVAERMSP